MTHDPRAVTLVRLASPPDAPALLEKADASSRYVAAWERQVRAVAAWPLMLSVSISLAASVLVGVAAPALQATVLAREPVSLAPLWASLVLAFIGFALISGASLGWIPLSALGAFRVVRDACFTLLLADSVEGGVPLPVALRVCGEVCGGDSVPAGAALARALESGAVMPPAVRVPGELEARMLFVAARTGTLTAAAQALRSLARARLERTAPRLMARARLLALGLAAVCLLSCAVTFYLMYLHALVG